MNIKQFRSVSRFTSVILKIASLWIAISVTSLIFAYFNTEGDVWFNFPNPDFPILNSVSGPLSDAGMQLGALIIVPLMTLVTCYVLWRGSQLFKYLAEGNTPFSFDFSQSVKQLGLILIITDIAFPLLYSFIVTTLMEDGHYFIFGVGSSLLIGLILFAGAEIFNYAINLQQLADDTV
ncbi:Protein of unknown function [Alkalibacterium putridalgicola]|uniref:DUF2975 domain-containing protein n=1 Tax=Alkalibacterium putridalgicola TaxID=426703 RepID=A0A1H7VJ66_9LACT|nr:DUF2975 domain-containing protein [Alkalibacterium putridalgicola]GEK89397.1 hypothetical protein APU01nite_14360 [Alkalibacterium putridalgicola]SEM09312.1 Protein of unknown function [Alkalibacterium putridalgicola]